MCAVEGINERKRYGGAWADLFAYSYNIIFTHVLDLLSYLLN